jgi:hypothetical protein
MRVLLTLLAVLLWSVPAPAWRAVAIVQTKAQGNVDNQVVTFDAPATTGNTLIAIGSVTNATQTLTITDSAGSTWSQCLTLTTHPTAGIRVQGWYAVAAGATTTVTFTTSGGAGSSGYVIEASGMGTPECDGSGTDDDDATSHGAAISLAPSTTNETVIAGVVASSSAATYTVTPATYSAHSGAPLTASWGGYKIVTSTSANAFASTSQTSEFTVSGLMAIKSGSAAAVPCLRGLLRVGC